MPHAVTIIAVMLAIAPARALAQHHHHDQSADGASGHHMMAGGPMLHIHAGLGIEAGTVEAFAGKRTYQGAMLMTELRRGRFEVGVHVPFYRIGLGGVTGYGLGDIHVMGRWVAWQRGATALGLSAGVMPPFGDDEHGLGMGHWMVMAGGFGRASRGRLSSSLSVGYGGAPGGGGHAEHGVPVWPPVAPMNAHELRATLDLGVALTKKVGVSALAIGAIPLTTGDNIVLAGIGANIQLGRMMIAASVRHGFAAHTADLVGAAHVMTSF